MKTIVLTLFLIWSFSAFSFNIYNDTIPKDYYIENKRDQLNIRFNVENNINMYNIPFLEETAKISPNLSVRYSLGFNYKFVSLNLGFRPGASKDAKENKGESDIFRIRIGFLLDNWYHNFDYNYIKGFYVKNTDDFVYTDNNEIHYKFPDLRSGVFSGNSVYKLNKNYSFNAIKSQNEIQIKSAGSFLPGIQYWFYKINGGDKIVDTSNNIQIRSKYNSYEGISAMLSAGYHYTFVYHKFWYTNINLTGAIGYDFYNITTHEEDQKYENHYSDPIFSLKSGIAVGYNAEKYFFGAQWNNNTTKHNYGEQSLKLHASANSFLFFIGYRFKAPEIIKKPIDDIEEKIPIFQ